MIFAEEMQKYQNFLSNIQNVSAEKRTEALRYLARTDLYFFLRFICKRFDMQHSWIYARCKEVQEKPDNHLDLWARDHYKSTIITFGLTIQDILSSHGENPLAKWKGVEPSIGFFSHTRGIAKGFLRQIKRELENNDTLKSLFPDVVWQNPQKEATKWSEDDGLIVKRKSNPKEATIEAWGLVDGQPTSKHFDIQVFDDVVTLESVRSPDMMRKTLESWEMSINLGAGNAKRRYVGTRYHFNDTYRDIIARNAAITRLHPATIDGTVTGDPVLRTKEWIAERHNLLGPYTFSTQMLLNPLADETQGLKKDWLQFHEGDTGENCNRYLLVDPAGEKKKTSDYTSMFVIGLGSDEKYRVLDIVRDRLNLAQRGDMLFRLHRKWRPLGVGYEKYGLQADIEYFKERMRKENYHFEIIELGGQVSKIDRIKRLIPSFSNKQWLLPQSLYRTDYQGKVQDLIEIYINEEYLAFPVSVHDDMLDCQSRIVDPALNVIWPRIVYEDEHKRYDTKRRQPSASPWAV